MVTELTKKDIKEIEETEKEELKEEKFLIREDYDINKLINLIKNGNKNKSKIKRILRVMGRFESRLERNHLKIKEAFKDQKLKLSKTERLKIESIFAQISVFDADTIAKISKISGNFKKLLDNEEWDKLLKEANKEKEELEAWLFLDKELIKLEQEIITKWELEQDEGKKLELIKSASAFLHGEDAVIRVGMHNITLIAHDLSEKIKSGKIKGKSKEKVIRDYMKTTPKCKWKLVAHTHKNIKIELWTEKKSDVHFDLNNPKGIGVVEETASTLRGLMIVKENGDVEFEPTSWHSSLPLCPSIQYGLSFNEFKRAGLSKPITLSSSGSSQPKYGKYSQQISPTEGGHLGNVPLSQRNKQSIATQRNFR
ncbi:hypothetical protein HON71_01385 [Candidatus Woesearchaeota archaeon]|jgi:hypothetical protein|nr:hypothetical protein [Candidatus Woesearchaeota archaeon]